MSACPIAAWHCTPTADMQRNYVRLLVGEMVGRAREARSLAIHGEGIARYIIAGAHFRESCRVLLCNFAKLRVAVGTRRGDFWDVNIVYHPPLVPTALGVDHEQRRNVREDIDEGARIGGVGRQTRLRLQNDANSADGRQTAISAGDGELDMIVYARRHRRKDIRLKAAGIEQIV